MVKVVVWSGLYTSFSLGADTITIINPVDENPRSKKNVNMKTQHQHGNVNVSGDKFSMALVFCVCNNTNIYWRSDDTQVVDGQLGEGGSVVNGCLGFDFNLFHSRLITLYHNTMF